jgi:hypothetical protein
LLFDRGPSWLPILLGLQLATLITAITGWGMWKLLVTIIANLDVFLLVGDGTFAKTRFFAKFGPRMIRINFEVSITFWVSTLFCDPINDPTKHLIRFTTKITINHELESLS